jgi:ATP-dependent DNA helicase RecQ
MRELEDVTELARKLLLSIIELKENYGSLYYIDFLRGSNAAHLRPDHKLLSAYSIGSVVRKSKWKKLIHDMLKQNYLVKTNGMFPLIKVSQKGHDFLAGNEKIFVSKIPEPENEQFSEFEYEYQLYMLLSQLQIRIARELRLASYLIVPESTLFLLAAFLPHTKEELRTIRGFGGRRIEKYGQQFLDVIVAYSQANELTSRVPVRSGPVKHHVTQTQEQTLKLFSEGKTVADIAEHRNLMPATIESHLAFFVSIGRLPLGQVMDGRKIAQIRDTVQRLGKESLSLVRENLGEHYSYAEIRYVIAYMDFESKEVWTDSYYKIEFDAPLLACD